MPNINKIKLSVLLIFCVITMSIPKIYAAIPFKGQSQKTADYEAWLEKASPVIDERTKAINSIITTSSANTQGLEKSGALLQLMQALHQLSDIQLNELAKEQIKSGEKLEARLNKLLRDQRAESDVQQTHRYGLADDVSMIFVPIIPCRFADSRDSSAGKLNAGSTRPYYNYSALGQGGASNCNSNIQPIMSSGSKGALALTITVHQPEGSGWLVLSPYNTASTTSVLNYAANQTLANSTVVKTAGAGSYDIQVYTVARAHVILDLLGFYVPSTDPLELDCYTTSSVEAPPTSSAYPGSVFGFSVTNAPACSTGYTAVSVNCYTNLSRLNDVSVVYINNSFPACGFRGVVASGSGSPGSLSPGSVNSKCCRVITGF